VELPAILSDEDMMPEIMRAYAERMRRSVKPDGGRQEGGATSLLDSLGVSLYNTLASPSRLVNSHMAEYQPGVSVQDMPETMRYLPEVATNVVGLPGVMGAVPEGALGSAARDPSLWHGISKVKLPRPISEMNATHVPTREIAERSVSPADMQGGWLLPALGDRSTAGSNLVGYNGYKFDNPVPMQGGHGFMSAHSPDGVVWASGDSVASRIAGKAKRLGETGDVYFPYTAMGERSVDFSHHVSSSLAEAVRQQPLTRAAEREFNRAMKTDNKGFGAVKDWPGVKSDNLGGYLLDGGGDVRNKFAKLMDSAKFQEMGFPSVAEARHAVTDSRLLNAPTGASGLSISKLDPSGKILKDVSAHQTYSADVPGKYLGGLGRSVPKEVFYPDMIGAYEKMGFRPDQYDYLMARGVKGAPDAQRATQQWVDRVSKWLENNPKDAMKFGLMPAILGGGAASQMQEQPQQ
jgi:hypothetical protein